MNEKQLFRQKRFFFKLLSFEFHILHPAFLHFLIAANKICRGNCLRDDFIVGAGSLPAGSIPEVWKQEITFSG